MSYRGASLANAVLLPRAMEQAHEAFVAVNAGGSIAAWNAAAERLYGYTAAEVLGRPVEILYFPAERFELASLPSRSGGDDGPREWIQRQRHKSGGELRVALRILHFEVPDQESGLLLCALDVSAAQRAEEERTASRAALEASHSELRRLAARLVASEEEARRRVGRELHDDVGQRLAALAFELEVVRRDLLDDAPRSHLDAVGAGLAELSEDLRRLSHDLHPAALERRGLAAALADHCAEVEHRHHLPVRFSVSDAGDPFPPEVPLGLFRIAQEALSNAVRHARARGVHVTLRTAAGTAHLAVADDGVGFDPDVARRGKGLGLTAIEERAHLLGGRCRVASLPGAGTEIDVCVPLPPRPSGPAATVNNDSRPLRHVGPYRLLEEIGSGSMATVYLAEEPAPLGRRVAIKLHRGPFPGRRETLRFRAEQQALARLHHPAIAQVYEARTTEDGDLYIAMEHVPGLPITDYCDRYGLDLSRRLALFAVVCDGVRHAHQKGVLHRDLKPANVLVMEDRGVPRPKIIDFGVAKGLDRPLADGTVWTAEVLVGTPAYLAPEALDGGEIDARSEVYALGVVLYELLVGTVPIAAGERGIASLVEAVRRGEVPPPSRRLGTMTAAAAAEVARRRGLPEASRLARLLAGELDWLASTALAPDPAARYPTVDALGKEIRRVLAGEPIEAGPPGALHQLRRLARRHRRLTVTAALVILALAGGLVATARQAHRAEREAARADAAAHFLEDLFKAADPRQARGEPPDARELLRRGSERLGELSAQPLLKAWLLDALGGIYTELGLFDEAQPLLDEALTLRERLRGAAHLEVAATLVRLGALAHLSGKGEAEPLFRRALAICEARLGPDHSEVADVLNKLGATLAARGRLDEAQAVLRRALAVGERRWGKDDPRVAKVLHNLAGIAFYRDSLEEAERLLERALAIRERTLEEDDPDLAGSREALAVLRQQQGRPAEAAALLERLVTTAERVYGPRHPDLARALLNLGLARQELREDIAARRHLERALAITERALAPDHPLRVQALASLANFHFDQGRFVEAELLYRRLVELHRAGAPYDLWDRTLANWARLLAATGREAEATRVVPERRRE